MLITQTMHLINPFPANVENFPANVENKGELLIMPSDGKWDLTRLLEG